MIESRLTAFNPVQQHKECLEQIRAKIRSIFLDSITGNNKEFRIKITDQIDFRFKVEYRDNEFNLMVLVPIYYRINPATRDNLSQFIHFAWYEILTEEVLYCTRKITIDQYMLGIKIDDLDKKNDALFIHQVLLVAEQLHFTTHFDDLLTLEAFEIEYQEKPVPKDYGYYIELTMTMSKMHIEERDTLVNSYGMTLIRYEAKPAEDESENAQHAREVMQISYYFNPSHRLP